MFLRAALRILQLEAMTKVLLVIILFLSIFLGLAFIEIHTANKLLRSKNTITVDNSIFLRKAFNLELFIKDYLQYLFIKASSLEDSEKQLIWLSEHTYNDFFEQSLKKEIKLRQYSNLGKGFELEKLDIQKQKYPLVKVLCLGKELLLDSELTARDLSLELLVDTEKEKVKEILSLKEI